ncbi:MAG: hypothetical protein H6717_35820 [Polyangiaceae bacterium]|nr:hypothetical protein [Polyangiaceae bacterium]
MRRALLFLLLLPSCKEEPAHPVQPEPVVAPAPAAPPVAKQNQPKLNRAAYPWLGSESAEPLEARFAPPAGYTRVALKQESFGYWLRGLPLSPPDTPVRTYAGSVLHPASDRRIAGVVDIDVGQADLQQCADAVMRLHAEWKWSRGERDASYRAAAGLPLPFARYARGERLVPHGAKLSWEPSGKAATDHAAYRKYLDSVFAWANTVSLEKQAKAVDAVRPGDFFILPGNPGHTVLVVDLAKKGDQMLALLAQSFMPAQSVHVLRSANGSPWFTLRPGADVVTPFWKPFPWASLRRLD